MALQVPREKKRNLSVVRGKTQIKTSQYRNIQSNAIVCVLVSCYLCFCPAEGHVFHWCLRLRCCLLLHWVCKGVVLFGLGGCSAGMPGYAICPGAEWLLMRRQPLALKLHR